MENTNTPAPTSPEALSGQLASPDAARFLDSLLARVDLIAEQAINGQGLDPRAVAALAQAPLSAQAQAFRHKLTAALADKATELAENDLDAASHGLARAASALGARHSRIQASRPVASMASAYPTLASIFTSKRGSSAPSIAAKAIQMREEREAEESAKEAKEAKEATEAKHGALAKPVASIASELDDILGGMDEESVAPSIAQLASAAKPAAPKPKM